MRVCSVLAVVCVVVVREIARDRLYQRQQARARGSLLACLPACCSSKGIRIFSLLASGVWTGGVHMHCKACMKSYRCMSSGSTA